MKLSHLQLEAFATLSKTLNFTQASKALHLSQSALSQRILNLEAELETTLFVREPSGIRLTEAAERLLRYCQVAGSAETEFLARLKGESKEKLAGVVRIGAYSSVARSLVIPSLKELFRRHAALQLALSLRELRELPAALKSGEVDFILLDQKLEHHELASQELGTERYVLVEQEGFDGPDTFLDNDEADPITLLYLRKFGYPMRAPKRHYVDDIYGIIDGVRLGLGRAVLPLHLIQGLSGLSVVSPKNVMLVPVVLHYYQQPYHSQLHGEIVRCLERGFKRLANK